MIVRESIQLHNDEELLIMALGDLNESWSDSLFSVLKKISDKKKALTDSISRFNSTHNYSLKKKLARVIIALAILTYGGSKTFTHLMNDHGSLTKMESSLAKEDKTALDKIIDIVQHYVGDEDDVASVEKNPEPTKFKDAAEFTTSEEAKNVIKDHEKLRLKAYRIKGDGKITIGWGHAEPVRKSKYRLGQKITLETAQLLFDKDIKVAEDGVKRIFAQWKESGNDIKITQGMFDAMVSIAFNAGISGLRQSEFIQGVKKGNFMAAAEKIQGLRNTGKFGGLDVRRNEEKKMFIKDILN